MLKGNNTILKYIFFLCYFLISSSLLMSQVVYVNKNATGAKNGSSWIDAYTSIQVAVNDAIDGGKQVWVAKGVYYENLTLHGNVSIWGGFSGDEMSLNQRNYDNNVTIIDGNYNGRVVLCYGNNIIDGFTITHGYLCGTQTIEDRAGAGILSMLANCTIKNNQIKDNYAGWGAGIFVESSGNVLIENNLIYNNHGFVCAGGIEVTQSQGHTVIRYNTIVNNIGFGLEIPAKPGLILGDFHSNIVFDNEFNEHERFTSRPKGLDVWGYARVCSDYSFIGEIWEYDPVYGSPFDHPNNIYGDYEQLRPMFVNYQSNNFQLAPDSPCIDTGKPDQYGGLTDMGAIQFSGSSEVITVPEVPNGPNTGAVGENLTFTTGGSVCNYDHSVEYQFNWGDGQYSAWGAATESHSYDNTGTFQIKARARCQTHTSVVSGWSSGLSVSITPNEYLVKGDISYYSNDEPVPNVLVEFSGEVTGTSTSDIDGEYSRDVESGLSFNFTPTKTKDEDVGMMDVTTYDAALTARHALNLFQLEPNQVIAADADKNGAIYTFDSALIARYAVGLDPLPNSYVGEWLFLPDSRDIQNISSNHYNEDFTGIIIGNVHGGWTPSGSLSKTDESVSDNRLISFAQKDNKLIVLFYIDADEDIISSDIEIAFDQEQIEYLNCELTALTENFHLFQNEKSGRLRLGLYSPIPLDRAGEFLKLVFLVKEEQVDPYLRVNQYVLNDYIVSKNITRVAVASPNQVTQDYRLEQNYPNPFNSSTSIKFHIPEAGFVKLKIFNLYGQEVITLINGFMNQGSHQFSWDGKNDNGITVAGGIYLYQLECKKYKNSRKLLILQ